MRIERNPHLPLVMECPKTSKTFRLHVNSSVWEVSDSGTAKCPLCGEKHDFNKTNTRSVAFAEAEKLPQA